MALWKPLLGVMGATFVFNDAQHAWVLYGSLLISVGVAAWDLRRSGSAASFCLTLVGAALMVAGHALGEDGHGFEVTGVLVMLSSVGFRWVRRARLATSPSSESEG